MVLAETLETPGQQMGKLMQNGVSQLSVALAETLETPGQHTEHGCRMGYPSCLWCWLPAFDTQAAFAFTLRQRPLQNGVSQLPVVWVTRL